MTHDPATLRDGEQRIDLSPPADATLRFIGHIETPFTSRDLCPRQGRADGPICTLHLAPDWTPALAGLEAFESIEVLYWLHESRRDLVLQSPKSDGQTRGTFSLRSPVRPNPIGTSMVRLLGIDGPRVHVRGLDCLNGTPLLDIKPNRCDFAPEAPQKAADAQWFKSALKLGEWGDAGRFLRANCASEWLCAGQGRCRLVCRDRRGSTVVTVCKEPAIPFDRTPDTSALNRARGRGLVRAALRDGRTVLRDLAQSGSGKLLFPRSRSARLEAVWLNTAGGITGGDRFDLSAQAETGAALTLTTQAAERVYRASPGAPGRVFTDLTAGPGARIDWLPQETILFEAAALDRRLRIDMAADARVLACEALLFGRAAMGEAVHTLFLRDHVDLRIDGHLRFADRLRLDGDAAAHLARTASGARAMASVILAAPEAARHLEALRALLPATAGVSAPDPDVLFLRLLAPDGFELRRHLIPVLRHLSGADLPRPWML
ncbi:tRNA (N6-threonylcarbamoyladenosine(37)-N6)-methyltransferase TrmO [Thalassococcus sp. BH17M4-6]|uniref:tRNA (N6-threonylcarbamoyladenosine(37)-N6)-methyltransferase TrmO n=1 Tax=Thalassococcus sp. BH17M4-6 TaxID=3413148 RepID=UPI003BBE3A13